MCVLVLASGCGRGLTIEMTNGADVPIHIWLDGFEQMGLDNKVEPETTRIFMRSDGDFTSVYTVHAGRNEATLATTTCSPSGAVGTTR